MPDPTRLARRVRLTGRAREWLAAYDLLSMALEDPRIRSSWSDSGDKIRSRIMTGLVAAGVASPEELARRQLTLWRIRTSDTLH